MSEFLCLIPAKGCSTRLPRKNLLKLGNKSLLEHTIGKALGLNLFSNICVSTEDPEIQEIAKKTGAEAPFLRPEKLSRDPSTIVDVVIHAVEYYSQKQHKKFGHVCVLLPTSPFVNIEDIESAAVTYKESKTNALLSVCLTEFPPFNSWVLEESLDTKGQVLKPCFPDSPYRHTKSTECPETYRSNGAILIVNVESLLRNRGYQGNDVTPFIMPQSRSLDIDTQYEYELAQFMYQKNRTT